MKLVFSGPVKNCDSNLEKNLNFLINLKKDRRIDLVDIFILEGDSTDNSKIILEKYKRNSEINLFIKNNLEKKISNRVERIVYCRNLLLKEIKNKETSYDFYIPLDLDVELFSKISTNEFIEILTRIQKNDDIDALFPFSVPFYYDLAALRSVGWVEEDIWIKFNKMAKKLKIGKIFLKILLIFNKQIKKPKNKKLIQVESAFGGIGLYKLKEGISDLYKYGLTDKAVSADHIVFNSNFNKKYIDPSWTVCAPLEHIEFKTLSLFGKMKYIYKELQFELKNLKTQ